MPRMNGGKALIESLYTHGVDTVFGVLGSTLLRPYDALCDRTDIRLIAPRSEDGALHMADAYARVTGKVGVAMVTVGAGAAASLSAMAFSSASFFFSSASLFFFSASSNLTLASEAGFALLFGKRKFLA